MGAGANIALNLLLIPKFGAMGASVATLLSYVAIWLVRAIDSRKILPFAIRIKRNIAVYFIIAAEVVLVCTDNNPYYIVSAASIIAVCVLCREVIADVIKMVLKKLKLIK